MRFPTVVPPLQPEHIEQFRALYLKRFGVELSGEEGVGQLINLVAIVWYQQENLKHQEAATKASENEKR